MDQQKYEDIKRGERGAVISIVAYLFLSALKYFIGQSANSEALMADGINNATDIIASLAVLIGLRLSRNPADKDHPYGHWKSETVASLVASFIMMIVGLQVIFDAVKNTFKADGEPPDTIAAWTGLSCAVIMYGVYWYNRRLADRINSHSLMAAAKDNRSDAWVSIGTAVGIFGSQFGLPWLDPVTAIVVGLLICKTAWDIFREASHHLTDGFDEDQIEVYKETIRSVAGVKSIKDIKARSYGNNIVVDLVILVNPTLDIKHAHDISTNVEKELMAEHGVYDVHVHIEPK